MSFPSADELKPGAPLDPAMGWIGVDLDGTLAEYHEWVHHTHIGAPIPRMVERVKRWLEEGKQVKIFTARVVLQNQTEFTEAVCAIRAWCKQHIGQELKVTCIKDMHMIELWDDRAIQVIPNTGIPVQEAALS